MGLIQIIKDNYIIWHHKRAIERMENKVEYIGEYVFLIDKNYFKIEKEYHDAISRECDRLWAIIQRKYPSKEAA